MATIRGTAGKNTLRGTKSADTIFGLGGNDLLIGSSGNDTLYGGAGNDLLRGSNGNDALDGGSGINRLLGENGNDTMSGRAGRNAFDGGTGTDTVSYADAGPYSGTLGVSLDLGRSLSGWGATGDTFASVERVIGTRFDDDLNTHVRATLYGGGGDDVMRLFAGGTLYGGAGNDLLNVVASGDAYGGAGDDQIYIGSNSGSGTAHGDAGNDTLRASLGAGTISTLDGGAGADDLYDGGGITRFVLQNTRSFASAGYTNTDEVIGFDQGQDKLLIDNAIYAIGATLDASELRSQGLGTQFVGTNAQFIFVQNGAAGVLMYDEDGVALGHGAVVVALLDNTIANLTLSDFVVV